MTLTTALIARTSSLRPSRAPNVAMIPKAAEHRRGWYHPKSDSAPWTEVRNSSRVEAYRTMLSETNRSDTFEQLALPLVPSLYNHAFWMTRDQAEAEDLVQETFSKALRAFDSFKPGTNFKAWTFRILRNTFLATRTGIAASRTVFLEDHPEILKTTYSSPTPEDDLIRLDNQAALHIALEQLPPQLREILLLCDVEEIRYKDIALTLSTAATPQVISTDRHTVKPWFQGRLPFSFNLPDTVALPSDTILKGADLTYLNGQPAALLLFTIHKHEVSIFLTQRSTNPTFSTLPGDRAGFTIHTATTSDLRIVAISDVNPADLDNLLSALMQVQKPA